MTDRHDPNTVDAEVVASGPVAHVLGLGNVLMGDDGFGPAVIRALEEEYAFGSDVSVVDLGTPGFDLMPWLADARHVIIVDTVKSDGPPGTLRAYSKRDLVRIAASARVTPHDPGLRETVEALELAGRAPDEITIVGVVPGRVGLALELTAPVRDAVAGAVAAVLAALERSGVVAVRRAIRVPHESWWGRSAGFSA